MAAALLNWERVAAGVTLETLWLPVTQGSSFCVGSVLLLLAADVLLFAALTWYSDKVCVTACRCNPASVGRYCIGCSAAGSMPLHIAQHGCIALDADTSLA
jgi:hypothetical protein